MTSNSGSILQAHPTGNANVRGLLEYWEEEGILERFVTTIGFGSDSRWLQWLPVSIRRELERRRYPVAGSRLMRRPMRELIRHSAARMGLETLSDREDAWASIDTVYRDLDRYVASILPRITEECGLRHLYLYEDGASTSFARAERLGIIRHYDLPIGYWRAKKSILRKEAEKNPIWGSTIPSLHDSREKRERKDRELALADHVFVASSFTRRTLEKASLGDTPVSVIPYGAPEPAAQNRSYSRSGTLKVLFVGGLSQRKGISYLFDAVDRFGNDVQLTVVGRPRRTCPPLERALDRHVWYPSMPHGEVLQLMARNDVLVFPTLFEGFGLVLTEALSRGTPIIATDACAAPDLITDGEEGFLVPTGSSEAIEQALARLVADRELLVHMGRAAHAAAARLTWRSYASEVTRHMESRVDTQVATGKA